MRRYGWRRVVSPSMGVAFLALLVALGGSSYAVTKLDPRSVGSKQLKRQAVTGASIRPNAVGPRHLKKNAVTASRIDADAVSGAKVAEMPSRARTRFHTGSRRNTDRRVTRSDVRLPPGTTTVSKTSRSVAMAKAIPPRSSSVLRSMTGITSQSARSS